MKRLLELKKIALIYIYRKIKIWDNQRKKFFDYILTLQQIKHFLERFLFLYGYYGFLFSHYLLQIFFKSYYRVYYVKVILCHEIYFFREIELPKIF